MKIAVLTVSDSRSSSDDTSGDYLVAALTAANHELHERLILPDDRYLLRALISQWIAEPACQVILMTGGTGFTGRDSTPEAIEPLLDKTMPGFGELFRALSHKDVGTSALQSRAFAGLANGTIVVSLPGSTGACRLAWEQILQHQLEASTRPCNLAQLQGRFFER